MAEITDDQLMGVFAEIRHYQPVNLTHSHTHHQIILPLTGGLELEIGGRAGKVGGLWGAIVPGNWRHSYQGQGENGFLVVDFYPMPVQNSSMEKDLWRLLEGQNFFPLDYGLHHYLRFAAAELPNLERRSMLGIRVISLLVELILHHNRKKPSVALSKRLGPALAYLHSHYDKPVTVKKLAALANLSLSRFYVAFRCFTGKTPAQYLIDLRLSKAISLLQESHLSIGEIALIVGYGHPAAFAHAFHRYYGAPPSFYRVPKG